MPFSTVNYYPGDAPITPNLGLSLVGMDEVVAEDMILIDTAFGSVGGSIKVNGSVVNNPNFINSASATFSVVGSNISLTTSGQPPLQVINAPTSQVLSYLPNPNTLIFADATAGALSLTLPSAIGHAGYQFCMLRVDNISYTHEVSILTTSAQTINGMTPPIVLENQWDEVTVVSDGSNWEMISTKGGISVLTPNFGVKTQFSKVQSITQNSRYFIGSGVAQTVNITGGPYNDVGIIGQSTISRSTGTCTEFLYNFGHQNFVYNDSTSGILDQMIGMSNSCFNTSTGRVKQMLGLAYGTFNTGGGVVDFAAGIFIANNGVQPGIAQYAAIHLQNSISGTVNFSIHSEGGEERMDQGTNGVNVRTSNRATDSGQTGNFELYRSAAGGTLWQLDINGVVNPVSGLLNLGSLDTGISRLGAASLAVGNGTAGDFSGSLKAQILTLSGNAAFFSVTSILSTSFAEADVANNLGSFYFTSMYGSANATTALRNAAFIGVHSGSSPVPYLAFATSTELASGGTTPIYFLSGGYQTVPALTIQPSGVLQIGGTGSPIISGNFVADTGISRLAASSLAIGNGTAGNTTGNLSFNRVSLSGADFAGQATVTAGGTTKAVTFAANYTGTGQPVIVITPTSDPLALGVPVGYWVTYSGGAGAWTGWTVNIQTALAGDVTFNYVVIGNR